MQGTAYPRLLLFHIRHCRCKQLCCQEFHKRQIMQHTEHAKKQINCWLKTHTIIFTKQNWKRNCTFSSLWQGGGCVRSSTVMIPETQSGFMSIKMHECMKLLVLFFYLSPLKYLWDQRMVLQTVYFWFSSACDGVMACSVYTAVYCLSSNNYIQKMGYHDVMGL